MVAGFIFKHNDAVARNMVAGYRRSAASDDRLDNRRKQWQLLIQ
jgi:hypothetical protein